MTLTYAKEIKGKPTKFVDKIWQCLLRDVVEIRIEEFNTKFKGVLPIIGKTKIGDFPQKKHSIRKDPKNRWKAGNKIHNKIWTGRPYHSPTFQFTPVLKCVSTQAIEIVWEDIDGCRMETPIIFIDGNWIVGKQAEALIINDGFDSVEEFYAYFNKTTKETIIHWTNFKYD